MSSSYSEICSGFNQNYEQMDIGEDLADDEEREARNRPDSILWDEGQCKDLFLDFIQIECLALHWSFCFCSYS
jgi:hypothetical protein